MSTIMAYRRPPRVHEFRRSDEDLVSDSSDPDLNFEEITERRVRGPQPEPYVTPRDSTKTSTIHPFATDFGPTSLQQYLRSEIEKARPRRKKYQKAKDTKYERGKSRKSSPVADGSRAQKPQDSRTTSRAEPNVLVDDPFMDATSSNTSSEAIIIRRRRRQQDAFLDSEADILINPNRSQPLRDMDPSSPTKRLARSISGMEVSPIDNLSLADTLAMPDVSRSSTFASLPNRAPFTHYPTTSLRRSNRLREKTAKETNAQGSDSGALTESHEEMSWTGTNPAMIEPRVSAVTDAAFEIEVDQATLHDVNSLLRASGSISRRKANRDVDASAAPAMDPAALPTANTAQPDDDLTWRRSRQINDSLPHAVATREPIEQNDMDIFSCSLPKSGSASLDKPISNKAPAKDAEQTFLYKEIVPERLPAEWQERVAKVPPEDKQRNRSKSDQRRQPLPEPSMTVRTRYERLTRPVTLNSPSQAESSIAALSRTLPSPRKPQTQSFPRELQIYHLPAGGLDPPCCKQSLDGFGWLDDLSTDMFDEICKFLSLEDVRNLRLVNKEFAESVAPILFRHAVAPFTKAFFGHHETQWDANEGHLPSDCLMVKVGHNIKKFAISFELDLNALATAKGKHLQNHESTWWGDYKWPLENYPRFPELQELEDLVDDHHPLLREAFQHLQRPSELGLCIDSGHGWLNGPDLSDMAVFDLRCDGGTKVFGKSFRGENKWHEFGRKNLFRWAQENTLNEVKKAIRRRHDQREDRSTDLNLLNSIHIRDRESFILAAAQDDFDPNRHCGGRPSPQPNAQHVIQAIQGNPAGLINAPGGQALGVAGPLQAGLQHLHNLPMLQLPGVATGQAVGVPNAIPLAQVFGARTRTLRDRRARRRYRSNQPQWPIIFSGYNVAAEFGGSFFSVQDHLAPEASFPLLPGSLTEAQVQWLMETAWAQRAFLSAYTTAVIMNKANLLSVNSLCIAKLSSGLLTSLAQHEFWAALPSLDRVTIMVSPDWRREATPGERDFTNLSITPITASIKFAELLRDYIAPLERLSHLNVGFVGGGEHAPGICARNQNILPAPITTNPRSWLSDHHRKPLFGNMIKFDHIRNLKFENCWFTPCMLQGFMEKSRDTSLRHLILDSVSLTGVHSGRTDGPLMNADGTLEPVHGRSAWLQEQLPNDGCWPALLDAVTPGVTFHERKIEAGLVNDMQSDDGSDRKGFRGHVQKIALKSCGYTKISGVRSDDLNQNGLVVHNESTMDAGLQLRKTTLEGELFREIVENDQPQNGAGAGFFAQHVSPPAANNGATQSPKHRRTRIMMSKTPKGSTDPYFGLGTMTQAIHPVEKRVLEQAWGLTFGWGDTLERFKAVEDGWLEGGTGRFSGVIQKDNRGTIET